MVSTPTIAAIRFGFGFRPGEAPPGGPADLLSGLARAAALPPVFRIDSAEERRARLARWIAVKESGDEDMAREHRRAMSRATMRDGAARLLQRALGTSGLLERLAEFWANHFTVASRQRTAAHFMPLFEVEAIRPHVAGRFADMLAAVVRHPSMLVYLDQPASFGPGSRRGRKGGLGLNENLAREVLELHTLGADGPYTQRDVREFAELLTGYTVRKRFGGFHFDPGRAEPGAETVLGRSYGGGQPNPGDVIELLHDLARHPATARHLARKLAVHFVADEPDPGLVAHIAAAWEKTGGDLPAVYAALVEHPSAWKDFGAKVKRPLDLVVSTLRAAGVGRAEAGKLLDDDNRLIRALRRLGQPLHRAPGPDGWPESAEEWITPQGLSARLDFAGDAGQRLASRGTDPREFARTALGDALRPETEFAAGVAAARWEGIALVLASPEFNRR